jgi:sec-independent protein translocase protein TatA
MPFGIGPLEIVILLLVALLVFGPKRLPEMGRSLGRGMREFKDSISGRDEPAHTEQAAHLDRAAELPPPAAEPPLPAAEPPPPAEATPATPGATASERDTVR